MTKAVTYTRFSSDNQNEKSIDDQLRNCHKYAESQGWNVVRDYNDKAYSGKLQDRPGYLQMINDASQSNFDVIIVDDLSRLTRSSNATTIIEELKFKGIRLIAISDGIDSDDKSSKLNIAFKGIMNNVFLDDMKDKVHRGLMGCAINNRNTGGRSFGYKLIPVYSETELNVYGLPEISYSDTEIDEEQAKWVRQIYEWVEETRPYRWIAKELNRLKVPTVHGGYWTTSTLCGKSADSHSGILNNPLYIGKKYWNRHEKIHHPTTGKSTKRKRPESEWQLSIRPELKIINDELWEAVKKEQKKRKAKTASKLTGKNNGARSGPGPKYLLSGIIKCSQCGGNYIVVSPNKYGCGNAHRAGAAVCDNKEKIQKDIIEKSLISSIQKDLFKPEVIEAFRKEMASLLKLKKKDYQPAVRKLQSERKSTDGAITKLIDFITTSDNPPKSILEKISKLESKQQELTVEIQQQLEISQDIEQIIPRSVDRYNSLVENLIESCKDHIPPLREKVKKLLGGEVLIAPKGKKESAEGTYRGSFTGLLELGSDTKISDGTLKVGFSSHILQQLFFRFFCRYT